MVEGNRQGPLGPVNTRTEPVRQVPEYEMNRRKLFQVLTKDCGVPRSEIISLGSWCVFNDTAMQTALAMHATDNTVVLKRFGRLLDEGDVESLKKAYKKFKTKSKSMDAESKDPVDYHEDIGEFFKELPEDRFQLLETDDIEIEGTSRDRAVPLALALAAAPAERLRRLKKDVHDSVYINITDKTK